MALLFILLLCKFFQLIDEPELKNFTDFKDQRQSLKTLSYFYVTTFVLRSIIFLTLGHVDAILGKNKSFEKYEIFLVLSTVLEAPNIFFLYLSHYKSFKKEAPTDPEITMDRYSASQISDSEAGEIDVKQERPLLIVITEIDAAFKSEYRKRVRQESDRSNLKFDTEK